MEDGSITGSKDLASSFLDHPNLVGSRSGGS